MYGSSSFISQHTPSTIDWLIPCIQSNSKKNANIKNDQIGFSCRNATEDYPGSDLQWDKEPAMRTQAPLCLSTDIYDDSQTTLPCRRSPQGLPLSLTLSLSIKSWKGWFSGVLHVRLYPLTYWTLSEPQDGCRAWNWLGWKTSKADRRATIAVL